MDNTQIKNYKEFIKCLNNEQFEVLMAKIKFQMNLKGYKMKINSFDKCVFVKKEVKK